jgi:hypothetical protein
MLPEAAVSTHRLECIAEALADLESIFADPTCFGSDTCVQDYAVSVESEFIGRYRDEHISYRLGELIKAEDAGRPKDALRHLRYVRRRIQSEWSLTAAKALVADSPTCQFSPQGVAVGVRA